MAWTITDRGSTKGTYLATQNVGTTFTPAENDIILVITTKAGASSHDAVTGWSASFVEILAPTGSVNLTVWAARIGASPSSGIANIDFGGSSDSHTTNVIQISGANTSAPIGVSGSNLFRQVAASSAYDPASPFSITSLSAFASATNLSLTLGAFSGGIADPIAQKSGFTELFGTTGGSPGLNVWGAYKASEDTAHQLLEQSAGDFDFKNIAGVAIEMLEAASGPTITDVDTDEVITSTQTGVVATITGGPVDKLELIIGGVTREQDITSNGSTSVTFDVVFDS